MGKGTGKNEELDRRRRRNRIVKRRKKGSRRGDRRMRGRKGKMGHSKRRGRVAGEE